MTQNRRITPQHPADESQNLILTVVDGKVVDEFDGREMSRVDIETAVQDLEQDSPDRTADIEFLKQSLTGG